MKKIGLLLLSLCFFSAAFSQAYKLDFSIKDMRDSVVILGYYNGEKLSVQDSLKLDAHGKVTISGKEKLPRGKYFLYLGDGKRFDMLLGDDQAFSLAVDTADLANIVVKGSNENTMFYAYIRFIQDKITQREKLQADYKAASDSDKKQIEQNFKKLNEEVRGYMDNIIATYPNTFFAHQLKADYEVEIPDDMRKRNNRDEMYRYYRAHYFDNIDFSEAGLARTASFPKKLEAYLTKYIPQIPDSIYPQIDMIMNKTQGNKDMRKFMLMNLHDLYVTSENLEMENVYVWFLDKYFLPEVDWMEKDFMDRVKEKSVNMKPLLIGNIAPDLTMEAYDKELHETFSNLIRLSREEDELKKKIEEGKDADKAKARQAEVTDSLALLNSQVRDNPNRKFVTLSKVQTSKYILLAFWEPDCSHCRTAIPALHAKYDELKKKGVEVYAACTQIKPHVWGKFLTKHKLWGWLNVWDPYNTSKFRDKYDIHSTPTIFILDKNLKILLKKVAVEHLDEAIKYLDQRYSK